MGDGGGDGEFPEVPEVPEGSWVFYRIDDTDPAAGLVAALIDNMPAGDITFQRDRERLQAVKRERAEAADAFFSANAREWTNIRRLLSGTEPKIGQKT